MDGDLDDIIGSLRAHFQAEALKPPRRELTERAHAHRHPRQLRRRPGRRDGFWEGLRALGELVVYPRTDEDAVVERSRGASRP